MIMSADSYKIYNVVYAVAQALHDLLLHQTEVQTMGNKNGEMPSSTQLHNFLKNIQFYNPTGDQVIWDKKRKLETEYEILNIWDFPESLELEMKVGNFSPYAPHGNQLSLSEDMIEWAVETTGTPHSACSESYDPGFRKSPQEGKAACCFDCIPCPENEIANETDMEQCVKCPDHQYANPQKTQCFLRVANFLVFGDPLGNALVCMALCFSILTTAVLGMFVKHQDTAIVKANNQTLSYMLLIPLIFCFLCSLLFLGRPQILTCVLQQIIFGVVCTVAVSTVLVKRGILVLAFKATSLGRRMRWLLVSGAPNFIIPICTLIQVTPCGLWLATSPPFVETYAHSEQGHIIILCNKGSLTAFYCVLGYLGFLALSSFTMAFLARIVPDTFNEAKFLTFSILVICSVWLTFLPVYHSAMGKVMVAVEVFSILASGAGFLGCIFAPKCYILLLMPNRNSLHGFRDKRHKPAESLRRCSWDLIKLSPRNQFSHFRENSIIGKSDQVSHHSTEILLSEEKFRQRAAMLLCREQPILQLRQIQELQSQKLKSLSSQGTPITSLAKVRQGPHESYSEFIGSLTEAAESLMGKEETDNELIKHLAFENANSACQAALHPHCHGKTITDFIRLCSDVDPALRNIGLDIGTALTDFI
ncbi:vomeronasal type-2 receptor 116-like [Dipodomys spectabilis]|uniref:vomeronasal type-2 receptor 116-like n=1 Tax=Dipodomys spectabilis TaxID=105255 RepID=UPI001C54430E|nr:vomeronasal type-2 receptor 116-like [Dipodomys spectabilis]